MTQSPGGPPGYGPQPEYGRPPEYGYGPPPGYGHPLPYPPGYNPPPMPPGYRPASSDTDGFAIAAFVLSILGGVGLAVIFGLIALSRIRRNRSAGRGLAIAALVISGVWVVAIGSLVAWAISTSVQRDSSGAVTRGGSTQAAQLRTGDCAKDLSPGSVVVSIDLVPCREPHNAEVIGEFSLPDGPFPGDAAITAEASRRCNALIPSQIPEARLDQLSLLHLDPERRSWSEDRTVQCLLISEGDEWSGSLT